MEQKLKERLDELEKRIKALENSKADKLHHHPERVQHIIGHDFSGVPLVIVPTRDRRPT